MTSPSTDQLAQSTLAVFANAVGAAADRLADAHRAFRPCAPVRDLIGRDDVVAAYGVQAVLHKSAVEAGRRVVGRKIGLTAAAVQAQLEVDQPDFGFLYADMDVTTEARTSGVNPARLLQPKIEAEVAFLLGADLDVPSKDGTFDVEMVAAAVATVIPALEIVDSRIAEWDISFGDTVADNASAGLFVLGDARADPTRFAPDVNAALADVEMTMKRQRNGNIENVSSGRGRDCLGSPLTALAWLAATALRHGEPLRAGQLVLAGALGPMTPVAPGDEFGADLTGLGAVTARFAEPSSRELR